MIRENYTALPTAGWTPEEAAHHLAGTFDTACKIWPDIMEPYVVRMAEADEEMKIEIIRHGLRDTVKTRFPDAQKQFHSAQEHT